MFPQIELPPDSNLHKKFSSEIYPRPDNTVYTSGPDDYDIPLPLTSDKVVMDPDGLEDVRSSTSGISYEINGGKILTKQAYYKPQLRAYEEGEEVGPTVGLTGINGLWITTGHDEWSVQIAPRYGFSHE